IERMWRDVYETCPGPLLSDLFFIGDQETLNPDNEVHLFALHRIFPSTGSAKPRLFSRCLELPRSRTERNQSPQQLWRSYREQGPEEDPTE
ncbi:unnamed protein product, partial [Lota lota]